MLLTNNEPRIRGYGGGENSVFTPITAIRTETVNAFSSSVLLNKNEL